MALILGLLLIFQSPLTIKHSEIEKVVSDYIASRLDESDERYTIEFRSIPSINIVRGGQVELQVNPDRGAPLRGNISLPVDILIDGKVEQRVVVSLRVRRFSNVYLTANALQRHGEVTENDVARLLVETTALPDDIITNFEQLVQKRTNRIVQEGAVLRESMFEEIPLIPNGSPVTVRINTGNVLITTSAIAREDGRHGDIITIQRRGSQDRLRGRVIDRSNVELVNDSEGR